jgi:hypothetical protein
MFAKRSDQDDRSAMPDAVRNLKPAHTGHSDIEEADIRFVQQIAIPRIDTIGAPLHNRELRPTAL